ncbi:peptidase M23 [Streptomyces sp. NPDC090442]|uniref:peptidase M23 n=1 Tax=Streptomyces sp. NPDC090442 TaxID=3365962 RepID=UPI0037F59A26
MDQQQLTHAALTATKLAKKGLLLKVGALACAVFLILLILAGALLPSPAVASSSCEDTGAGTGSATTGSSGGTAQPATGSVHDQQITNAKAIDHVTQKLGLSGKATLIALMTAMQESTLQNLHYGDRDSLGLFQQRPSMDWGTKEQILNPAFATESFFKGRGTNPGMLSIANWPTRPPGDVAQAVQKSNFPGLYAGHETTVRALAKEAGINLARGGTAAPNDTGGSGSSTTADTSGAVPSTCPHPNPETPGNGGAGGTFSDGKQTWKLSNPRSVPEAIAWAKAHAGAGSNSGWYQRCLAFTAIVYGWNFSGVNYAIDHFHVVPKDMQHPGDRNPPPGALLYWDTGHRAGHIAVYLGDGKAASNDILRPGYIDIVDADLFEKKWGAKYLGWTVPVFPRAG